MLNKRLTVLITQSNSSIHAQQKTLTVNSTKDINSSFNAQQKTITI